MEREDLKKAIEAVTRYNIQNMISRAGVSHSRNYLKAEDAYKK